MNTRLLALAMRELFPAGGDLNQHRAHDSCPGPVDSAILNGKQRGFSLARLIRSLDALGAGKVSIHIELGDERELVVAV